MFNTNKTLLTKKSMLTAVSVLAIFVSGQAMAEYSTQDSTNTTTSTEANAEMDTRTQGRADTQTYSGEDVEQGLENAGEETSEAWNKTQEETSEAWNNTTREIEEGWSNAKQAVNEEYDEMTEATITKAEIDMRRTAKGMLGQPVYNENGERVARVKDIILNAQGDAELVVLADGDFTGLGKLAAFEYDAITRQTQEGDVIATVTERVMDQAQPFNYDSVTSNDQSNTMFAKMFSVAELLESELRNANGEQVAEVDNISFANGEAQEIVVGYDKTLGLGGKQAAMNFGAPQIVMDGDEPQFRLSQSKSQQFEAYQETSLN